MKIWKIWRKNEKIWKKIIIWGKKLKNIEQIFCLSRIIYCDFIQIHDFFHSLLRRRGIGRICQMGIHSKGFTQIHELFINYYDNGEWEDMPYEYMGNMEEESMHY